MSSKTAKVPTSPRKR